MTAPKSAIFYNYPSLDGEVYTKASVERIASLTALYSDVIDADNFDQHTAHLADIEVIFATWGMIPFEAKHFAAMPNLKAVFYAAGNVRAFAQPLIDNEIILTSAWQANAIPVAEMCLSQILLSLRGYFRSVRRYKQTHSPSAKAYPRSGVNGEVIGMLGMGKIGTRLRHLLDAYPLEVIAYDPFLTPERAKALNIEAVSMEQVFARSSVVCNHIPDLPDTRQILNKSHFSALREGATFINTGRGAQVVEADLIEVLSERPDLTALLDVTMPEPPLPDSELWNLPNLIISPHIGGTIGDEVTRLPDLAIGEYQRWASNQPLLHQVTAEILETMG